MEEFNESFLDDNISEIETLLGGNKEVEDTIGGVKYSIFENLNDLDDFDSFDTCKFGDKEKNYVKYCYSEDIGKYPILSMEEIDELFKKYKKLGKRSPEGLKIRDKIINSNLRYSYKIAKHIYLGFKEHYKLNALDLNDFIQAGNIGLIYAVNRYTPYKGRSFFAFFKAMITYTIYNRIKSDSRFFSSISVGSARQVRQYIEKFQNINGRDPTDNELKDFCNERFGDKFGYAWDTNNYWRYYKYFLVPGTISLDQEIDDGMKMGVDNDRIELNDVFMIDREDSYPYDGNFEITLKDMILDPGNNNSMDRWVYLDSLRTDLKNVISTLNIKEQNVINMFYGLDGSKPKSLDEIGEELHLGRERTRQIKEKAKRKIKHSIMKNTLEGYLYE